MNRGLQKLFVNLSIASNQVEARKERRSQLQGYLKKIKIVSGQTAKKSIISSELQKMEKHIEQMLAQKQHIKTGSKEIEEIAKLKRKEKELDEKIMKMNELLAQVGKKVNIEKFKKQLAEPEHKSELDELEEKLYSLETKYYEIRENPDADSDLLARVKDKISMLKEKIRILKEK